MNALTFKVQGQIYHTAGSLLPTADEEHKFLQIYFMSTIEDQVAQRCRFNSAANRAIVADLQHFFTERNALVGFFRQALDRIPSDEYVVVIRGLSSVPPTFHLGWRTLDDDITARRVT